MTVQRASAQVPYSMGSNLGRGRQLRLKSKALVARSLRQRDLLEGKVMGEVRCGWSVLALAIVLSLSLGWGTCALAYCSILSTVVKG